LLVSTKPEAEDAEPVPKLPRGRGLKLSGPELFRIALTLVTLIGVVVLTPMCARSVANFVTSFDQDSEKAMPKPGNVDLPAGSQYERLQPGMSEQEIKAAIERAKANAAGSAAAPASGAGSAAAPATGAGSANAPASGAGSDSASPAHGAADRGTQPPSAPAPNP
jgi:hypothetical protein